MFCLCDSVATATAPMLVTKALSQDVMLLAFVPLPLIPKESPSLHSNQPFYIKYIFSGMSLSFIVIKQNSANVCEKVAAAITDVFVARAKRPLNFKIVFQQKRSHFHSYEMAPSAF
ncbi:hypothetical protein [Lysinibacillus sp. NPDC056232]|uniref:hypothetical protein n=1 Tax=Lysinibacillus sp. NPDC056232 TaxID=3345756 RepID=UPI0035E04480